MSLHNNTKYVNECWTNTKAKTKLHDLKVAVGYPNETQSFFEFRVWLWEQKRCYQYDQYLHQSSFWIQCTSKPQKTLDSTVWTYILDNLCNLHTINVILAMNLMFKPFFWCHFSLFDKNLSKFASAASCLFWSNFFTCWSKK